jgi:hypothetical protein
MTAEFERADMVSSNQPGADDNHVILQAFIFEIRSELGGCG